VSIGLTLAVLVVLVIIEFLGPAGGRGPSHAHQGARPADWPRVDVHKLGAALVVVHRRLHRLEAATVWSVDVLDDLDECVGAVAVLAGVVDEFAGFWRTVPRSGVPATEMPRPRRNSRSPSSRSSRRARSTVLVLTSRMAARSLAGGRRSPGLASPLAMARRISAATCS
jgi:hypothetical protein